MILEFITKFLTGAKGTKYIAIIVQMEGEMVTILQVLQAVSAVQGATAATEW